MNIVTDAAQAMMKKAVALAPDRWIPGGVPDPLISHKHGLIGKQVSRLDGRDKVGGTAPFAAEIAMEGMAYAALAFSTVARGRISAMDLAAAESAPGVVLVMTHLNAPTLKTMPAFMTAAKACAGDDLPIMQDDRVHWNGMPIAIVLADTQEQADHAASLITATYEPEPATTSFTVAKQAGLHQGSFMGEPLLAEIGDPEAALASAAFKVDATYRTPWHHHNALETHAVTVAWDGDEMRLHDASQCVAFTAWTLGEAFGVDESQVHVTSPYVGGGFGGKTLWQHHVLAAAASRMAGCPVRLSLSREGVYRIVGGRTETEQRVAIGADKDGVFKAMIQTGVVAMTDHNNMPEPFITPAMALYSAETMKLSVETAHMDMLANTFMRAPGHAPGSFAQESAIDELADAMGMDPIELRIRNEPEKDPAKGLPFSMRNLVQCYRDGATRFGWSERQATGTRTDGEWQIGIGMAAATYPYQRMPGGAARITITAEGKAIVAIAAEEMGMGTSTTTAMVAADRLGLTLDDVSVAYGDSKLPGTVLAGGSQQTASIGAAVIAAHRKLMAALLQLAGNDSPLAGLDVEKLGNEDAGICNIDDPSQRESYASILKRAGRSEVMVEAEASKPMESSHWSMHSYGAVFAETRVNSITGEVRVSRILGAFDCGRILNAKTAASQFRGGIIMGLGMALMEETQFDERTGRIMNPSLAEYHVPVHMDVPEIDVIWTDIADPHSPMGAHGVGEIGITGVAAAVANAVFNATGKRVRDLPITLDKLM